MRIGYSFWGFLGPGVTDTPDGGRSHRRPLIDALKDLGHEIVFLQADRDLTEAGTDLRGHYRWDQHLPDLDRLVLEWRWPIPGRNTTTCGAPGHTCDLHRQDQLLQHYTRAGLPTLIWDKDRMLPSDHWTRACGNVRLAEAAVRPGPAATPLLFPVPDARLDTADPAHLAGLPRDLPLVYIGNQYDRDDAFAAFFAPAALAHRHRVAGKWTRTRPWPHVAFTGRIAFPDVDPLYRRSLSTVLLLPERYRRTGQMTQRLFEAVLAGCLPLTPTDITHAARFAPAWLQVGDGQQTAAKITSLCRVVGTPRHAELIAACLAYLDPFRLSRQIQVLRTLLDLPVGTGTGTPACAR